MVTKSKGSSWDSADNLRRISLLDYSRLKTAAGDWSTAIVAALVDVVITGYPLYIPGGTYSIAPITIPDGVTITGSGTLKLAAASTGVLLTLGNNCVVESITLDGNNTLVFGSTWYPISITSKTGITIRDIRVVNAAGDAIHISGSTSADIRITGLEISNYTGCGINITSGSNIQIAECRISAAYNSASPGQGISLASDGAAITDISISQCHIKGSIGDGIALTGIGTRNITDITIDNCHVTGSTTASGIRLALTERILINNSVAKSNAIDGIRLRGDVQNCRVVNCSAVSNTGIGMEEVTVGSSPNNNIFAFNVCASNTGGDSIILVGAGSRLV